MTADRHPAGSGVRAIAPLAFALLGALTLVPEARAQCGAAELAKILANDGQTGDQHGVSVAISSAGTTALVGAPFDDDVAMNAGAVYVYTISGSTWALQAKLKANDGQFLDQFGGSVAINAAGDRALVGARFDDDNGTSSGSAYVFVRTGTVWTQQAKLKPNDAAAGDEFGTDVDLDNSGTFAVIGAPLDNIAIFTDAGCAYLFQFSGAWTEIDKLVAGDLAIGDNLGASVALGSGTSTILVGAPFVDQSPTVIDTGAAYVFAFLGGGYGQIAKFVAPDAQAGDQFGDAVALNAFTTRALVGAVGDDDNGLDSGSAYIFDSGWVYQAKLLALNGEAGDHFGVTVDLDGNGDRAAVGAPQGNGLVVNSGAAYVYEDVLSVWSQVARLQAADGAASDLLGNGVALTNAGDVCFAGAPNNDDLGNDSGSAYLFPTTCTSNPITYFCFGDGSLTTPCPCGNLGATGRGCANSQNGSGALLVASGTTSPDNLTLTASGELPTSSSIFLQGDQEIGAGTVFGDGLRCAGGVLLRLYVKSANNGIVTAPELGDPTISARSAALGDTIPPGSTRLYQVYYRDPDLAFCPAPPGNSFNVTNAARVAW